MSESAELGLKGILCFGSASLIAYFAWDGPLNQSRREIIAALASFAAFAFINFGTFHHGEYIHLHEMFHYYLGSKYFPELGYDGLYEASAAADRQPESETPHHVNLRDLRTNHVVDSSESSLRNIRERFTQIRWDSFVFDHQYFAAATDSKQFEHMRMDYGFNGTPTWALIGQLLTNTVPATHRGLSLLAALDPLLLVIAFFFIFRTYGVPTGCCSLLLFALSYPSRFHWVGGGLLRQDWLAASAIGICMLRRRKFAFAGSLFGYASVSRLFPSLFLLGPLVLALSRGDLQTRRSWVVRLAAGFALTVCIGIGAGCLAGRGAHGWIEFAEKIRLHNQTWLTNDVGLLAVFVYDKDTLNLHFVDRSLPDPWAPWQDAMNKRTRQRALWAAIASILFMGLVVAAVVHEEIDQAAVLSIGAIFVVSTLTCYYWSMLMLIPLRRRYVFASTTALLVLNGALCITHLCFIGHESSSVAFSFAFALFLIAWMTAGARTMV